MFHIGEATLSLPTVRNGTILVCTTCRRDINCDHLTNSGANVDQSDSSINRTSWPLDGGSLLFAGSHPWAYTYVNLGLGNEVTGFNISLVEGFNQTGNGTFCWSKAGQATLKALNLTEGQNASIQVIQISHSGAALYNVGHPSLLSLRLIANEALQCADITFSTTATLLDAGVCKNATGVGGVELENAGASTSGNGTGTGSGTAASATASGEAGGVRVKAGVVVGAFAVGIGALML
jgi:hypothetical protein